MSTVTETPASGAESATDESARQTTPFLVLQFFIFPMAIVAVCVAVFVVFGLVASGPKDPRAMLAEVRTGGGLFNIKRWQAAYALANALESESDLRRARADARFVPEVVALFQETEGRGGDDLLVRRYLAVALGRLGDPRAVPELLRTVRQGAASPDAQSVIYAAWALGAIGDPAALGDLLALAHSDDAGFRKAAVHALGSFRAPEAREAAASALEDEALDVRWNAAVALARHGDARGAPVLLQMMDRAQLAALPELSPDQRDDAVMEAVRAAAVLRDPRLREALLRARESDPSLRVREAARLALEAQAPARESKVDTPRVEGRMTALRSE
jgi:HEAT repeat protein